MSFRSRVGFRLLAVLYAVVGVPWFFSPDSWADRFPWSVSPFVAMTVGAWCLGNGWVCLVAARVRRWTLVRALVTYLLAFGLAQMGVLVWFRHRLETASPLTWPYIAALGATVLIAVLTVIELRRAHPVPDLLDTPAPRWGRWFVVFFVVFTVSLAVVAAVAPPIGLEGRVFPEPMTPFTLRAFGAFYLSLGVGAMALLPIRAVRPTLYFGLAGVGLVVPITATIPVFWDVFDISSHPLQALYVVAYVGVLALTLLGLVSRRDLLRG